MAAETLTFEVFRQEELQSIFLAVWPDLILVGNVLTDPPQIISIYKRFLRHYNCLPEQIDFQLFPTPYPCHDAHNLVAINIFHFIKMFAPFLQINDFCLTDVLMPSPKRAKRILSAMANFLLFTTSSKREEFVQEVIEGHKKSREQHEWRLKEIDRMTSLKNQYLVQREENELDVNKANHQVEEHVAKLKELRETKACLQKNLTRKNDANTELELAEQEEVAKLNKLSQEEEEYKKLIVKSPEGVQAELKQAQYDLERALEKQKMTLKNEAEYNEQDKVLDELYEELPYISRTRDKVHASWEAKKQLDRLSIESSRVREETDKIVDELHSHSTALSELEKIIQSCRLGLTHEKKAYTEELNLLNGSLTEKDKMLTQMSQELSKISDEMKKLEGHRKGLQLREAEALRKVEAQKQSGIAEADSFNAEVLKMSNSYAKKGEKFRHLPPK